MEKDIGSIIDGKSLALKHENNLREKMENFRTRFPNSRPPRIVSLYNPQDRSSVLYTKMKQGKAADLGIEFEDIEQTSKGEIENKIFELNNDENVDGIMLQLPLQHDLQISQDYLLNLINPQKDVDGLSDHADFIQATVRGVLSILEQEDVFKKRLRFVVVGGKRGMVGIGVVKLLNRVHEDVYGVSRADPHLSQFTKNANVLISATGVKNLIKKDMIRPGATVIDIGGDVDFEKVKEVASRITPPTGGVGPMTVISLMENVVESYLKRMVK